MLLCDVPTTPRSPSRTTESKDDSGSLFSRPPVAASTLSAGMCPAGYRGVHSCQPRKIFLAEPGAVRPTWV